MTISTATAAHLDEQGLHNFFHESVRTRDPAVYDALIGELHRSSSKLS